MVGLMDGIGPADTGKVRRSLGKHCGRIKSDAMSRGLVGACSRVWVDQDTEYYYLQIIYSRRPYDRTSSLTYVERPNK